MEEVENSELHTIQLSLNTLTGVSAIRLVGKINGKDVGFLIDTGATHKFIDPQVVQRLQLKHEGVETFEVTVSGGEKMSGVGCCKCVTLNIQGHLSSADFLVVPLGDAQIVLGTIWLRSLGPTIWDFSQHTLKFWRNDNSITLQGVRPGPLELIEGKELGRILNKGVVAYALQGGDSVLVQEENALQPEIVELLGEYLDIFQMPQGLPPPSP